MSANRARFRLSLRHAQPARQRFRLQPDGPMSPFWPGAMQQRAWHNACSPGRKAIKSCFCCENPERIPSCPPPPPTATAPPRGPTRGQAPDRRHPDPGDHGARATGASAAGISGLRSRRDDNLRGTARHSSSAARRRRSLARRRRPVLDPRLRRGDRLRDAALGGKARARRRSRRRDARLLREAAHDGRLEGADQRSASRRQLPDQRRPAPRAAHPSRDQRARPSRRHRVSRHDHAAVPRGSHRVGRNRRAHDGEPGAPRARVGPVVSGRLQERHQRRRQDRRRCDQGRVRAASFPVRDQRRPLGDRAHRRATRIATSSCAAARRRTTTRRASPRHARSSRRPGSRRSS